MQNEVELVSTTDQAAQLLHPVRARLLERFREPASAAEAARALELPRQRVGHHVRLLRRQGLLRPTGERRTGNFVEQLLQTTARAYVIAPQALGDLASDPEEVRDRFSSAYLVASAARTIREIAELRGLARSRRKRLPTLTVETEVRFRSPAEQSAFAEELTACLGKLARKYHDESAPKGRRFRFTVGGHPAVRRDPDPPSPQETTDETN